MRAETQSVVRVFRHATQIMVLLGLTLTCAGCATAVSRVVLPEKLVDHAELSGMDSVRVWGDAPPKQIRVFVNTELKRMGAAAADRSSAQNFLAISGGGEDGAFGAGLLTGWTATGTRPEFDLVTGVSTGALIAPFAFLGPSKDKQLTEVYTRYGRDDILTADVVSGIFGGPALADSAPLAGLIAKYVDKEFLREIARERKKGRILLVGTSNLDAQRPVLWDMGRIAMSGHPHALSLFRKILLASTSIPGAFPPVRIKVRADGQDYDEMHVDGGVTQQVFLAPAAFNFKYLDQAAGRSETRRLYILRNGKITPEWQSIDEKALSLAGRSISTLIKNQGIGDLYRIHATAQRDGIDFNLATIPATFTMTSPEPFDRTYMKALYAEGYKRGRQGYTWMKTPQSLAVEARR